MHRFLILLISALAITIGGKPARAGEVLVAVASNFMSTTEILVEEFQRTSGHTVVLVHGSTGKLYAQIVSGAPFDVFLSADTARPDLLRENGNATAQVTYAIGKLAYLVRGDLPADLTRLAMTDARISMADPATAPYGVAAKEVLVALRGLDGWDDNVVFGESVGQAFGFVATGNTARGLVAMSQVADLPFEGRFHAVPNGFYTPIRQDAVLLGHGASSDAADAFFDFLTSGDGRAIISAAGYGVID